MGLYFQANGTRIPLPDESIDLIITDPPFNIGFNGRNRSYNRISTVARQKVARVAEYIEDSGNLHELAVPEMFRVLKPTGTLWLIMGWNNLSKWDSLCQAYFGHQIGHVIWKYQFGVYTKRRPVTSHYHCLVYAKHPKVWTWHQQGYDEDVWIINRKYIKTEGYRYATKLPEELVRRMILRSSDEGETVLDPFAGSGTVTRVADSLGRLGIGSDLLNNNEFWKRP